MVLRPSLHDHDISNLHRPLATILPSTIVCWLRSFRPWLPNYSLSKLHCMTIVLLTCVPWLQLFWPRSLDYGPFNISCLTTVPTTSIPDYDPFDLGSLITIPPTTVTSTMVPPTTIGQLWSVNHHHPNMTIRSPSLDYDLLTTVARLRFFRPQSPNYGPLIIVALQWSRRPRK